MPLWLTEDDVASLVTPGEAVPVIEDCFRRMAAGEVELMPRRRFSVDDGVFAVMAAADRGLGVAGLKSYTAVEGQLQFRIRAGQASCGDVPWPVLRAVSRRSISRGVAPRASG